MKSSSNFINLRFKLKIVKYFSRLIMLLFFILNMFFVMSAKAFNSTRFDSSTCKITHLGTDYVGFKTTTAGGIRCQAWYSRYPLHKVDPTIKDEDFPEMSIRNAKNYCRNPTKDYKGPWCYTMDPSLISDECGVPLCNYGECRITGIGAEYGGSKSVSSAGRKCKSWTKQYKLITKKTPKFTDIQFSDNTRSNAGKFCRNPDNSLGGPWCYVEEDDFEFVRKEFCDVPFCDDRDCVVFVKNSSVYSTITKLNATSNVTFWMKLWNPSDEKEAVVKILFSLLPIPTSAKLIAEVWRAGVELKISNFGSGQTFPQLEEHDFEDSPNILRGSKWTGIWVTWGGGFISVGLVGSTKPLFMDEYKEKNTISSLYPENFLYFGVLGTNILWSSDFCLQDCEVHTTYGNEFTRVWPLQQNNGTNDIVFSVRSSHNIVIRIYQTPAVEFPSIMLTMGDSDTMSIIYEESENSTKQYLRSSPSHGLLNFWIWSEFTISIFGPHLRIFTKKKHGNEEVLYFQHHFFGSLRWFSIGSHQTIAHWTLFCTPDELDAVEGPTSPNCLSSLTDYQYQGSQWTGASEMPCIPWTSKEIPDEEKKEDYFLDGSIIKALNKCRNPLKDPLGPYCYTLSQELTPFISKNYCHIRTCRSFECRNAGTANDYMGTLSTTRSGRTCAKWSGKKKLKINTPNNGSTVFNNITTITTTFTSIDLFNITTAETPSNTTEDVMTTTDSEDLENSSYIPTINPAYLNDSLYPENSVFNASNYCRDPSKNIAGTWCYTTDPEVPQDLCDIQDCDKPEECIFLLKGHVTERRLYVLPEYRTEGLRFSVKIWEPDNPDSISLIFMAEDGFKSQYVLQIGANVNEEVVLYYQSEEEGLKLVKQKTLYHLLHFGKWSEFTIRIPRGKVQLYYEGAVNPLFEWEHPESANAFSPVYYYFNSEYGNAIGIAFDCNSKCHIENTKTDRLTRIIPLSIWSLQAIPKPDRVQLMIRAEGVVLIPLLLLPATPGYYGITLGESGQWIYFLKNVYPSVRIYHKQKAPGLIFTNNSWTNVTIKWINSTIFVFCNETQVFHYEHTSPLLFYFFTVVVDAGSWATWTANCLPSDIDGDPRDGGWSEWGPWTCSVSCNGGIGTRKRYCNNPEPNVKGEPCLGPSMMTGRCNTIVCGDLLEDTEKMIKRRSKVNHTSLVVKEGLPVTISSDKDIIDRVTSESPKSAMRWSLNGMHLEKDKGRIRIENYEIVISEAVPRDSGIYTLTLRRVDETYTIIKIVSLAVQPVKDVIVVRETLPMSITCHCATLGYVYTDLNVIWMIGKTVWKDYGTTLPLAINVDFVRAVNKSHNGSWKCIVKQEDLNFQWTTNILIVKVLGAPNWRTHLMEDKLTRPIFGWMPNETFVAISAIVLFLGLVACIILGAAWIIRFQGSLKIKALGRRDEELMSSNTEESRVEEESTDKTTEESEISDDENQNLLH